MRMTLLDIVQDILSDLDSDEVNSIGDTTESRQVATAVKHAYMSIVSRSNLPEHFELFELNASNDPNKPTLMYIPEDVLGINWIKYDIRMADETEARYSLVKYLPQDEFHNRFFTYRDQNQADVVKYTISGPNSSSIEITGLNNKSPDFYTTFNDREIIFDSYDKEVDNTLMKNKTICYGEYGTRFLLEDSFVPDLDPRQFSLLYNEAKAACFADLKQTSNERAERKVKQGWTTLQHQKSTLPSRPSFVDTLPNYGKRGLNGRSRKLQFHS